MKNLFKLIILMVAITPFCINATTLKLKDIYDEKGMAYILKNHESISKKIDSKDRFDLAGILISDYKGPEALPLLLDLAKKSHVRSMALLIEKYSQGLNGIAIDEKKSRMWVKKFEALYGKASDIDRRFIEYQLCEIYGNEYSVLNDENKEKEYCSIVFERPENLGFYASQLLKPASIFYDPKKGVELFDKCIQDGDWVCKVNYALNGLGSPEIAKRSSAKQLFEYASDEKSKFSANAVNNLGLFYERGIGTKADIKKAIEQFDKAIRYGSGFGMYNLLYYSFLYPGEFESTAKTADYAQRYLMVYDYWTAQNGRFDVLPYKEWLSEKNRMPTSQSEFVDYLKDKSKNGDARSSCLLADYYRNINQPDIALDFANNGKKSNDKRISEWCSFVERSVEVMKIYSK